MPKVFYKVLGVVVEDNKEAKYRLCYTSDKIACLRELKRNGWKSSQIEFIKQKNKKGVI